MAALFRTPVAPMAAPVAGPQVKAAPPSTDSEDPVVKKETTEALEKAASVERKSKGKASTILTSGMGLDEEAPTTKRKLVGV